MLKKLLIVVALLGFTTSAFALPERFIEGKHYQTLATPVPTSDPDRIEVREYFSYGCIHCSNIQPFVNRWESTKADDVNFVQNPVFSEPLARAYFVAYNNDLLDKTHNALFSAIFKENKKLNSDKALAKWFEQFGLSQEQYIKQAHLPSVNVQMTQAYQSAVGAKIDGTPSFTVDGRYTVLRGNLNGEAETFAVIDFLVGKVRSERK